MLSILLYPKRKKRSYQQKYGGEKIDFYMQNCYYYYFELPNFNFSWDCTTKIKLPSPKHVNVSEITNPFK